MSQILSVQLVLFSLVRIEISVFVRIYRYHQTHIIIHNAFQIDEDIIHTIQETIPATTMGHINIAKETKNLFVACFSVMIPQFVDNIFVHKNFCIIVCQLCDKAFME